MRKLLSSVRTVKKSCEFIAVRRKAKFAVTCNTIRSPDTSGAKILLARESNPPVQLERQKSVYLLLLSYNALGASYYS